MVRWPCLLSLALAGPAVAAPSLHAEIDRLIEAPLGDRKPSAAADDAEFLRRLYLDFAGRIQDVGGVRCLAFTAGGSTLLAGGSQPKTGGFVQGVLAFDFPA
jgi:hypothetical protein